MSKVASNTKALAPLSQEIRHHQHTYWRKREAAVLGGSKTLDGQLKTGTIERDGRTYAAPLHFESARANVESMKELGAKALRFAHTRQMASDLSPREQYELAFDVAGGSPEYRTDRLLAGLSTAWIVGMGSLVICACAIGEPIAYGLAALKDGVDATRHACMGQAKKLVGWDAGVTA